jgi:hypothetical protein
VGPRPAKVLFINWYVGKLHLAARNDATLGNTFLRVANMQASPTRLLHPAIILRVLWGNLRGRGRANAEVAQAGAKA